MKRLDQVLNEIFPKEKDTSKWLPSYIPENLNPEMELRDYQNEAIKRFVYYFENIALTNAPVHNLFQMATGSGKTLVMAALMIYLYKQGYRRFLFFVNSNNIIDKTRDNFLNEQSSKYLFNNKINIEGETISIREVQNFYAGNTDNIEIIFTTIQALHFRLQNPRENAYTYTDLTERPLALLSDEAHHINVATKKGGKASHEDSENWETTVAALLQANKKNVLAEFTATANLLHSETGIKYFDKLLYDYSLKEFRRAGYSKEVKILQAHGDHFYRALLAILFSQYRKMIFADYGILCKPVVLFKSRTINDSKAFYDTFSHRLKALSAMDLREIRNLSEDEIIKRIFDYLDHQNISLDYFVQSLKLDFAPEKLLSVNSREESEEKQLAVNTLEQNDNTIRAIFAVDKLNEGWDVLNLFDIVRLYDAPVKTSKKPNITTVAEAQLIGRGARYFPFQLNPKQPRYQRKFDVMDHPLRVGETLYYHSLHHPEYVEELNTALIDIGIKAPKNESPESSQKANKIHSKRALFPQTKKVYTVYLKGFTVSSDAEKSPKVFPIKELGPRVLQKAFYKIPFYHFDHLSKMVKGLRSLKDLVDSDIFEKIWCAVYFNEGSVQNLTPRHRLSIATSVLIQIKDAYKAPA